MYEVDHEIELGGMISIVAVERKKAEIDGEDGHFITEGTSTVEAH